MATQSFLFVIPDDYNLQDFNKENVRTAFILRLPFRVRVGAFRRLRMDAVVEVIFRNTFAIPTGPITPEDHLKLTWIGNKLRPREELFTDVMILDRKPDITDDQAAGLAECCKDEQRQVPDYNKRYFIAHEAMNDAIVAYHTATNHLLNGYAVERLTDTEFFDNLRYAHTILCPSDYEMTENDLKEIFDAISSSYYQGVMLSVIMVGQAVLNRGSEARAIQDHNTLLAEVALLRQIIDREREIEDRLGIEDSDT